MSSLAVSGWLLGKNKAADQEMGDSCLICSVNLNPAGVQHFLIEGLVFSEWAESCFTLGMLRSDLLLIRLLMLMT